MVYPGLSLPSKDRWGVFSCTGSTSPGDHSYQDVVLAWSEAIPRPAGDQGAAGVTNAGTLAPLSSGGLGAQHARRDGSPIIVLALFVRDHFDINLPQLIGDSSRTKGAPA